jgi:hypothetical protein
MPLPNLIWGIFRSNPPDAGFTWECSWGTASWCPDQLVYCTSFDCCHHVGVCCISDDSKILVVSIFDFLIPIPFFPRSRCPTAKGSRKRWKWSSLWRSLSLCFGCRWTNQTCKATNQLTYLHLTVVSKLANGEAFLLEHGINKDIRNDRCILHIYCVVILNRH